MKKRILILLLVLSLYSTSLCACTNKHLVDNAALLEFPGLKWGATPEEVKTILELKDTQIIADEQQILDVDSYDPGYETWNLFATDLRFFDCKAVGAHFVFIRYPGQQFGLMRVQLYLPDNIDMKEVKADMVKVYGEGSTKPSPKYSFREGKLIATEIDVDEANDGNMYRHYWLSSAKGNEILPAAVQEGFVEYAVSKDANITRESALEYLEKEPLVTASCATSNVKANLNEKYENPTPYITQNTVIFSANQLIQNLQKYGN